VRHLRADRHHNVTVVTRTAGEPTFSGRLVRATRAGLLLASVELLDDGRAATDLTGRLWIPADNIATVQIEE
jgi:hypothetical protein